jgi:ATP-dependent RNA helicase DHX8/PRP22
MWAQKMVLNENETKMLNTFVMHRGEGQAHRNPDWRTSLLELQGSLAEDGETHNRKRIHRISSPEKWEIKQVR